MPGRSDTIAAIATPPGLGGIAVIRVSGPMAGRIARQLTGISPEPRRAQFCSFLDHDEAAPLDTGILLFFPGPASYTGEDVAEFHGHGGPVVARMLLNRILQLGARPARPGEFTERAFLNDKLDLAQAEAVADLIGSKSEQAARSAMRSLQGTFSGEIAELARELMDLRVFVEGALDFPDEEIDFLADADLAARLTICQERVKRLLQRGRRGQVLRQGVRMAIVGRPNVGKSSLLNRLTETDRAIVTEIPGTTRDVLEDGILVDGMYFNIIDTAGIHDSVGRIEQEGIRRSLREIDKADLVLLVIDAVTGSVADLHYFRQWLPEGKAVILIRNKIDLVDDAAPGMMNGWDTDSAIALSALSGEGLPLLLEEMKRLAGLADLEEDVILARTRHLEALEQTAGHLQTGRQALIQDNAAEIVAEELQLAHHCLGQVTGQVSADDLLGEIFARFCIGK